MSYPFTFASQLFAAWQGVSSQVTAKRKLLIEIPISCASATHYITQLDKHKTQQF